MKIDSRANPRFKSWSKLLTGKGLKSAESFLIPGRSLVHECLECTLDFELEALLVSAKYDLTSEKKILSSDLPTYILSAELFEELDVLGTHFPLLLAKQPEITNWQESDPIKGLEILCPLGDPQNLGALARSAEAFAAGALVLLQESAHPFLQKAIKASAGALLRHPLQKGPSIHDLKDPVYGLDAAGTEIEAFSWPSNMRLLVGEEGAGVPKHLKVHALSITMAGGLESLNATVATSIALYSASRAHPGTPNLSPARRQE